MAWADYGKPPTQQTQTQPSTTQQASGTQQQPSNPYAGQTWQQIYGDYRQNNPATGASLAGLLDIYKQNGINASAVDHYGKPSDDKLWIDGNMYDFGSGMDNPNGPGSWWENVSAIPGEGNTPAAPGSGSGGFDYSGYMGSGMTYTPWAPDPRNNTLWDMLMNRSQQSLVPTADNPVIKSMTDAFRAEQERGSRNYLNDLAEKNGPYANNSTEARMAHESAAQNTANLQASLLQNEVAARRQEIQQALSEMGGLLSDDQRLALQKELGYLQNDQFLRNLGLEAENLASIWDWRRSGGEL